jgi:hypothetical protein
MPIQDLSTIFTVYDPRNRPILAIFGPRNKQEPFWQFMVQFLVPETAGIWLCLDIFLKYLFFLVNN